MSIAPRRPKVPPLNALRAFEAAARLGGFTAAAEELCVTPGAVAQHVKTVERWFGAELFARTARGVSLTPVGQAALREFGAAFDRLGSAVNAVRAHATPSEIRIAALPSAAQLWLSPRLAQMRRAVEGCVISVTALENPPNLLRDPFDLALFFEAAPGAAAAYPICDDVIFPVCAPALAAQLGRLEDLTQTPCLRDSQWRDDWSTWLTGVAGAAAVSVRGPSFSLYALAVAEALNGAGVLMGHEALLAAPLASGALVAPFPQRVSTGRTLTLSSAAAPLGAARAAALTALDVVSEG